MTVPVGEDSPRTKAWRHGGRCYELAYRALVALPPDTQWFLTHGQVIGIGDILTPSGLRVGHAWLECAASAWCPTTAKAMSLSEFPNTLPRQDFGQIHAHRSGPGDGPARPLWPVVRGRCIQRTPRSAGEKAGRPRLRAGGCYQPVA
jgi:hypothetical protein